MTETLSEAARDRIFNVIATGPFGVHVGMVVDAVEVDRVIVRMPAAPHTMNGLGIAHGGATATLLDTAATCAAWATPAAKPTTRGTTVALTINYIGAGRAGDMIAEAQVISRGGTLTIVDVTAKDEDGRLVAKAQATYKLDLARDRRVAAD
ncbi:MAG: PaaI family thioesterase [Alphaproteobacteria bacterium]